MTGPDFLCAGMQKAGTGWLYDQLAFHPAFRMPPVKEVQYLHRDRPGLGTVRKLQRRLGAKAERGEALRSWRREMDGADLQFLDDLAALRGKERDVAAYADAFSRFKRDKLSGDISPGYSGMSEAAIREVARILPDIRVLQMVRDPVARLWSQLNMALRKDKLDAATLTDVEKLRAHLYERDNLEDMAFASRAAERWRTQAPDIRFRVFFYDDLVERPEDLRRDVLQYLGADPDMGAGRAGDNRKSKNAKLELPGDVGRMLADFLRGELEASARVFGGPAQGWLKRYFP
jgi:hypothetical protein